MNALEALSILTTRADEHELLKHALKMRGVSLLSGSVTIDGPVYISIAELAAIQRSESPDKSTILLWNSRCSTSLSATFPLMYLDTNWQRIDPRYGEAIPYPHTQQALDMAWQSFLSQPLTAGLISTARINRLLSPVIEISIPAAEDTGYTIVTADFSNFVNDISIVWNVHEDKWQPDARKIIRRHKARYSQPEDVLQWQSKFFVWLRKRFANNILESESYRY